MGRSRLRACGVRTPLDRQPPITVMVVGEKRATFSVIMLDRGPYILFLMLDADRKDGPRVATLRLRCGLFVRAREVVSHLCTVGFSRELEKVWLCVPR